MLYQAISDLVGKFDVQVDFRYPQTTISGCVRELHFLDASTIRTSQQRLKQLMSLFCRHACVSHYKTTRIFSDRACHFSNAHVIVNRLESVGSDFLLVNLIRVALLSENFGTIWSPSQENAVQTNREKYRAARARAETALASGKAPRGLATCGDCGVVLQETVTGHRRYSDEQGDKKAVCSDCYFDSIDDVLAKFPLKSTPVLR